MVGTRCAVANCNNSYAKDKKMKPLLSFHSFPKDSSLRESWIAACQRENDLNPNSCHICSEHFSSEDFESEPMLQIWTGIKWKPKLKTGAVPLRNLPSDYLLSENPTVN